MVREAVCNQYSMAYVVYAILIDLAPIADSFYGEGLFEGGGGVDYWRFYGMYRTTQHSYLRTYTWYNVVHEIVETQSVLSACLGICD